jgi:hypothetical protein
VRDAQKITLGQARIQLLSAALQPQPSRLMTSLDRMGETPYKSPATGVNHHVPPAQHQHGRQRHQCHAASCTGTTTLAGSIRRSDDRWPAAIMQSRLMLRWFLQTTIPTHLLGKSPAYGCTPTHSSTLTSSYPALPSERLLISPHPIWY